MYQKVLVPLDQPEESEKIIEKLPQLVAHGGNALLLTIVKPAQTRSFGELVLLGSQQEEEDTQKEMSYLRVIAEKLSLKSVDSSCWVTVTGSPAGGIVAFASQNETDLISMYTHDRRGLARLMRGSVAKEVVGKALCPVLILGPKALTASEGAIVSATQPPGSPMSCAKVDLFQNLSEDQIGAVAALGGNLNISAGQTLGEGGSLSEKLFVIINGEARLTAHSDIGEIVVRIAGPEQSFPLAVLLGEGSLITAGEALTDMLVLEIPREALLDLCRRDPQIGMGIYAAIAKLFANRYDATLNQLGVSVARELHDNAV